MIIMCMVDDFKDFQAYGTVTFVNLPTYEVEQCALIHSIRIHNAESQSLYIKRL